MAHWAQIDDNNIVLQVLVTSNEEVDEGYQWLIDNLGGRWIKTSYNTRGGVHLSGGTPLRMNFAGIGFTYDEQRNAFIPPKPTETVNWAGNPVVWDLDEDTCQWIQRVVKS
jgi:hypothetical protein